MKNLILPLIMLVTLMVSCKKKDCESAKQRTQQAYIEFVNASQTAINDPSDYNLNKQEEAQQNYNMAKLQEERTCN